MILQWDSLVVCYTDVFLRNRLQGAVEDHEQVSHQLTSRGLLWTMTSSLSPGLKSLCLAGIIISDLMAELLNTINCWLEGEGVVQPVSHSTSL